MIDGLDADDQYIMVEDEFLATARAFTAHLHQAEYTRKRKQAKTENASKVMKMTRPTDPHTSMNNTTKKSIEREALDMRHEEALEKMKKDAGRPQVDDFEMEDNNEEHIGMSDEDRDDDPWVGTSLQTLMVTSKQSRPLMGLQAIRSSTKAALGYCRPANTSGGAEKTLQDKGADEGAKARPISNIRPPSRTDVADHSTASSDDDDLGVQARTSSQPPAIQARPKTAAQAPPSSELTPVALPRTGDPTSAPITRASPAPSPIKQPHVNIRRSGSSSSITRSTSAPKPPRGSSSRFAKFFDELDEPAKEPGPSPAKCQVKCEEKDPTLDKVKTCMTGKREDREEDKKLRKQRLSQVPTFL